MVTWLGLALLAGGSLLLLLPRMPATPLHGAMTGVPRTPAWVAVAICAVGVALLVANRNR